MLVEISHLFQRKWTRIDEMENRGKSLKARANHPAASREELRPSISGGINDQEQEHRGHGHLDRLEKVNLGEELAFLRACCLWHG